MRNLLAIGARRQDVVAQMSERDAIVKTRRVCGDIKAYVLEASIRGDGLGK